MTPSSPKIPNHVAIIMDGNGRWATQRNLSRSKGHQAGADNVDRIIDACLDHHVKWLTLYAFSSENWNRPKLEVTILMNYLYTFLKKKLPFMIDRGIRFHTIGEIERLPKRCQDMIAKVKEKTKKHTHINLVLALSYGGRDEITRALKLIGEKIEQGSLKAAEVTQKHIEDHLYTADIPDPDLLIRTSGEIRISNFLLWQLSYTEIHITQRFWPDFDEQDLALALKDYAQRQRRFGGL